MVAEWGYLTQRRMLWRVLWRGLFDVACSVLVVTFLSLSVTIIVAVIAGVEVPLGKTAAFVGIAVLFHFALVAMWRYAYVAAIWTEEDGRAQ